MTKTLPQVDVKSGLLHESPNGWLWQIYADLDTGRMLVLRSRPDGTYLPDWHTNLDAYEQYRALNPNHELPDLSDSQVGSAAEALVSPVDETGEIDSSHAGTGNLRWTVEGVDPDYRVPVGSPVPFDSAAILGEAVSASCRVPDEYILHNRSALLIGREVLVGLLSDLSTPSIA